MNEKHHGSLKQYVNDMIGLERDILNAIQIQLEDDRVKAYRDLSAILTQVRSDSEARLELLKQLSTEEEASIGAVVKESITAVTGTLAGIYGKVREHPVSRMVRDDIIALDVASVGYGMLFTLGLSIGHDKCAELAGRGVDETPPLIIALTDMLPIVVAEELAADGPLASPSAVQVATTRIRDAWKKS